jgi:hypothetical protein
LTTTSPPDDVDTEPAEPEPLDAEDDRLAGRVVELDLLAAVPRDRDAEDAAPAAPAIG